MQCNSCGTFLPAGTGACPNCGASVTVPQPAPTQPQSIPTQHPEKQTSFYDEYIPFTDPNTPSPTPPVPSEPSEPSELPIQMTKLEGTLPPLPMASPTPPRRTPLLALTTSLSIFSLLIIIILIFLLIHNTTENHTVQTPPNQFTTSDPQAIYTQVTTKKPAVSDAFSSKTSSTWAPTTTGNCTISGNSLHATASQGGDILCASTTLKVSNFACQVQMTLTQGDTIGLIFRANPTTMQAYVIELTSQGTYLLGAGQTGTTNFKVLAEGINGTINGGYGHPNLLTIIAQKNIFYLYVNRQFIVSISDPSSSSGLMGVASGGTITNVPVDATFSHFQVWNL